MKKTTVDSATKVTLNLSLDGVGSHMYMNKIMKNL